MQPTTEEPIAPTIDLMAALRASVERARAARKDGEPASVTPITKKATAAAARRQNRPRRRPAPQEGRASEEGGGEEGRAGQEGGGQEEPSPRRRRLRRRLLRRLREDEEGGLGKVMTPLKPMMATPGKLPDGPGWAYEVKWDGFRAIHSQGRYHGRSGLQHDRPAAAGLRRARRRRAGGLRQARHAHLPRHAEHLAAVFHSFRFGGTGSALRQAQRAAGGARPDGLPAVQRQGTRPWRRPRSLGWKGWWPSGSNRVTSPGCGRQTGSRRSSFTRATSWSAGGGPGQRKLGSLLVGSLHRDGLEYRGRVGGGHHAEHRGGAVARAARSLPGRTARSPARPSGETMWNLCWWWRCAMARSRPTAGCASRCSCGCARTSSRSDCIRMRVKVEDPDARAVQSGQRALSRRHHQGRDHRLLHQGCAGDPAAPGRPPADPAPLPRRRRRARLLREERAAGQARRG